MHYQFFYDLWATLTNSLWNIGSDLSSVSDANLTNVLLHGNQKYYDKTNQIILMHVIKYIKSSQIFNKSLFNLC